MFIYKLYSCVAVLLHFKTKKKDTFLQVEIKINLNKISNAVRPHSQQIVYRLGDMGDCFCRQQRSNLMLSGTLHRWQCGGRNAGEAGRADGKLGLTISKGSGVKDEEADMDLFCFEMKMFGTVVNEKEWSRITHRFLAWARWMGWQSHLIRAQSRKKERREGGYVCGRRKEGGVQLWEKNRGATESKFNSGDTDCEVPIRCQILS